jgi:hypothetical protein
MASAKNALVYKGHPLRRKDNILYYGSMSDKYIIMMQIMDTKPVAPAAGSEGVGEIKVATRVSVQLQLTDPTVKSRDRVVKKTEKGSLYAAIDVASVWLERALTKD